MTTTISEAKKHSSFKIGHGQLWETSDAARMGSNLGTALQRGCAEFNPGGWAAVALMHSGRAHTS